jgi:poly-gamma-glutamate synthase PgsB/CapB
MNSAFVILVLLVAFAIYGLVEYGKHKKRIASIPIRIHVNGTRGKSSVTRLIGAGLRAGGIPTITKVTGTFPRLILEDGSDVHIHRRGDANIIEQLAIVRFAARRRVRAVVLECMALEQQYQRISEHQMIHATTGVITNVRLDHIDIMGYTLPDIAKTLGETIPDGRPLFTAENVVTDLLRDMAAKKQSPFHVIDADSVSRDEMKPFPYIEHRENVALALAVCGHLGVDRDVALKGMYRARPDAGVLRRYNVETYGKRISFYNAFAANDPDSTLLIWNRLQDEVGFEGSRVVLLNTRQDRLDRARQLAEMVGKRLNSRIDYLMLIGECTEVVRTMSIDFGVGREKILRLGWTTPEAVFENALSISDPTATIVAIGNMGGMGAKTAEYFERRSISTHDRTGNHSRVNAQPRLV